MRIPGRVSNGIVVLEGGHVLPEGAHVTVILQDDESPESRRAERVRFPIVRSKHPGSVKLTGEMVAEYLQDEDLSARR